MLDAVAQMREAARQWTGMAVELKGAFAKRGPARIEAAGEKLDKIAILETRLMQRLLTESAGDTRFER